jgi:hypothetical protein
LKGTFYVNERIIVLFGVWGLGFGVWRLAFGVWRLAFGVGSIFHFGILETRYWFRFHFILIIKHQTFWIIDIGSLMLKLISSQLKISTPNTKRFEPFLLNEKHETILAFNWSTYPKPPNRLFLGILWA